MATTLGCGAYEVFVKQRGGRGNIVGIVAWDTLSWERVLDDTSQATVSLNLADPACCDLLSQVRPWQHELSIYRDGSEIWVGPLVTVAEPPEQNQLTARDITAWWDRRFIHEDHFYTATDIATIFQEISDDAMAPDPSPGLVLQAAACGVTAALTVLAAQHLIAAASLRDLATIGLDWTAVARTVLAGGTAIPSDPIGLLEDEHFAAPPQPTLDGLGQANAWGVRGSGGGQAGDTIFGYASDPDLRARDGLLEAVVSISSIEDNDAALSAAQSRVALRKEVVLVDGCVLSPSAPVTIGQLIAGTIASLKLAGTCIPVDDDYRIQKISGNAQASDGSESVTLALQPVGTE